MVVDTGEPVKTSRWQRLRRIVENVELLPLDERDAALVGECRGDEGLLCDAQEMLASLDNPDDVLAGPINEAATLAAHRSFQSEQTAASYHVRDVIGSGGMGTVYLADRVSDDFEMQVAIKTLSTDPQTSSYTDFFGDEARNLASLSHPNIARLIDTGVATDGLRYLVMEYVDGVPLLQYADQNHLSRVERIKLLLPILSAVQHAHNHLLLHCDIKPSNIMVDMDGIPKLLDFGISAAVDDRRQTRESGRAAVGSLGYSAPEQLLGQSFGTSVDIYGLGTTLFELLAETPLLRKSPDSDSPDIARWLSARQQVADAIESSPLDRELQSIVARATRYDAADRYESSNEMFADLRAYIEKRPISALANSAVYRFRKFAQRNVAAMSLVAVLGVVSVAFVVGLLKQRDQIAFERDRLAHERSVKSSAIEFLSSTLKSVDPMAGASYSASESDALLARIEQRAVEELAAAPELRSELYRVLGDIHHSFGSYDKSLELLTESIALLSTQEEVSSQDLATSYLYLGNTRAALGENEAAATSYTRALSFLESDDPSTGALYAMTLLRRADVATIVGDYDLAEATLNRSLQAFDALSIDDRTVLSLTLNSLGHLKMIQGDNEAAVLLLLDAREITRSELGADHADYGQQTARLAALYRVQGRIDEAEQFFLEALDVLTRSFGETHQNVMNLRTEYSRLLQLKGDLSAAMSSIDRSIAIAEELYGRDHYQYGIQTSEKAHIVFQQQDMIGALALYEAALPILKSTLPEDHAFVAVAELGVAAIAIRDGRMDVAAQLASKSRDALLAGVGEQHWYYQYGAGLAAYLDYRQGADGASAAQAETHLSAMSRNIDSNDFRYRFLEELVTSSRAK